MKNAERFRTELLRRGVLLVPVIWGEGKESQIEKKGFGATQKAAASLPSIGVRILRHPLTLYVCACVCPYNTRSKNKYILEELDDNTNIIYDRRFSSSLTLSCTGRVCETGSVYNCKVEAES